MGTTAQKLQAIQNSKAAIKTALQNKGIQQVGDVLSNYATYINSLPTPLVNFVATGELEANEYYMAYGSKGLTDGVRAATQWMASTSLTSVDLSGVTSAGIATFSYAFQDCPNLRTIVMPSFAFNNTHFQYAFKGTNPIGSIYLNVPSGADITKQVFVNAFRQTGGDFTFHINYLNTVDNVTAVCFNSMFCGSTGLKSIRISGFTNALNNGKNSGFGTGASYFLKDCTSLTTIEWSDLEVMGKSGSTGAPMSLMDVTNTAVREMRLPKLRQMNFTGVQSSSNLVNDTVSWTVKARNIDWYFPQLTVIGRYGFYGIADCTLHFAAANRTAIESLTYYSTLFGAENCTVLFDL